MTEEPIWVPLEIVHFAHDQAIEQFGGLYGMRDEGLLEAALNRPLNKFYYEAVDLPTLAAAYCYGIVKAHAFIDGNKRTALAVMDTFLELNGLDYNLSDIALQVLIEGIADDKFSEEVLVGLLKVMTVSAFDPDWDADTLGEDVHYLLGAIKAES